MEKEENEVEDIESVGVGEELKVPCSSDKREGEHKDDDHHKKESNTSRIGDPTDETKEARVK